MIKILLIEDDFALAKSLVEALKLRKYEVVHASQYQIAMRMFYETHYDILIVDIQLPDGNGIELCKEVRKHSQIPILFLTANDNEDMLVDGLNSGGDDYMTKPFRVKELLARINALMRRTQVVRHICVGELRMDIERREVYIKDEMIHLSAIDFDILKMFMTHKNQVLTRRQLLEAIEQDEYYVEDNTLSVHVKRLRNKLGEYRGVSYIETVRGIGYRLNKEVLYGNE